MSVRGTVVGTMAALVAVLCASAASATDLVATGSGMVSLSPVTSDLGTDEKWQVHIQGSTGANSAVTGTVTIAGIPVGQPDYLGKVDWQLSGTDLSGSVMNPNGGAALASFKGTVSAQGAQGTFTTADGQSGSWAWNGPVVQPAPGDVKGTTE